VVTRNNLPSNPVLLFVSSAVFNIVLGLIVFALFGGRASSAGSTKVTAARLGAPPPRTAGWAPAAVPVNRN
jgi:hypothetical protein